MKQKMVIRLQMDDAKKRSKALTVAAGLPGVLSAGIEGADKNQIVVTGDGVDSISLTTLLRKRMGYAEIISVSAVGEKKEDKEEKKEEKKPNTSPAVVWPSYGYPSTQYYNVPEPREDYDQDAPSCGIM